MKKDESRRDGEAKPATDEGKARTVVSALMDERRRYETWIEALDARRDATPEHVFTRVQMDYATRLDAVIKQLESHSEALNQEIQSLAERLDTIRVAQMKAQDERAEAELRAHVGEVTADDWTKISSESDVELAGLATRHDALEEELARTRALLDSARRPSGVFAAINFPEPELPPIASVVDAVASEPEPATEPAEVQAVVDESTPAIADDSADAPPMELPPAVIAAEQQLLDIDERSSAEPSLMASPSRPSSKFDELAFLSSVVDTPAGTFEAAPTDQPDERTRRDTFARRSVEDAIVNLTETGEPLAEVAQVVGRPSTSEGVKSLKCGECGAMNYPTEWYCERCGAELASL